MMGISISTMSAILFKGDRSEFMAGGHVKSKFENPQVKAGEIL